MKKLSFYLVYPLAYLVGILPYRMQFVLADIIYIVLYKLVGYRVKTVRENLLIAFPEKSDAERKEIERKFYRHLSDVFIETLSMAAVGRGQIKRRLIYTNLDEVERWTVGRSWLSAMGHYGSWEYTINFRSVYPHVDEVLAVYRPLHNQGVDKYYHKVRSRFGVTPVPMKKVGREIVCYEREGKKVAVALIADQTPKRHEIQNWTLFFDRWTPFFLGMEKLAVKLHIPVLFLHMEKVGRGYYQGRFELIYDGREEVAEGEITRRYAERLEKMIRNQPQLWMWSHRRWKHKKDE